MSEGRVMCSAFCNTFDCPRNRRHIMHEGRDRKKRLVEIKGTSVTMFSNFSKRCPAWQPADAAFTEDQT